jgi:hypothetical protein
MDEEDRLAALFREAAGEPPPGFDHRAVVARSRRVTARRRAAVLGSAAALVVVLGTGVVVSGQAQRDEASTAAAPAAGGAAESGAGGGSADRGGAEADSAAPYALDPALPLEQSSGPLGPGTTPCADRHDPALRALLEQVLPEVSSAPSAPAPADCRPGGLREVNLEVVDGTVSGRLTVTSLPAGESPLESPEEAVATAATASGGTVVVRAEGDGPGAPVPFAGRLDQVAAALAPAL